MKNTVSRSSSISNRKGNKNWLLIKYYDYEVVEKGMTAMEQRLKTEKVRKRKLRHLMYRDLWDWSRRLQVPGCLAYRQERVTCNSRFCSWLSKQVSFMLRKESRGQWGKGKLQQMLLGGWSGSWVRGVGYKGGKERKIHEGYSLLWSNKNHPGGACS